MGNLDAALEYADRGWKVFPLWPNTKKPIHDGGFHNGTTDATQIELWWSEHPNANIGLNLVASGLVAVDCDTYKTECEWEDYKGNRPFEPECIHRSARGGWHYIFKAEEGQTFSDPCSGVEIKHEGYIVLAPSTFEGKPYTWVQDDEPTPAPDWLADSAGAASKGSGQEIIKDWTGKVADGRERLWRDLVIKAVARFRAKHDTDPTELEVWDECWPVFDEKTIEGEKWRSPNGQATLRRRISNTLRRVEKGVIDPKNLEQPRLKWCVDNAYEVLTTDPVWDGVLAFDEFSGLNMLLKPIPNSRTPRSSFKPRELKDADFLNARRWFDRNGYLRAPKNDVIDVMLAVAQEAIISPVRHYLEDLHWDGESRLDGWLINYCDAENTYFNRTVGKLWMISAVARALQPGCKADCALVLEGRQGAGKSTAFKVLAGEDWFHDGLSDLHSKDAAAGLRGKWIIELPELSAMRRSDVESVKAFLSRSTERFRPAYARAEIIEPRRCVFAGTTNRQDYLADDTGGRRFWPVSINQIDVGALRRDRDQLWAEAVHLYQQPEVRWWLNAEDEQLALDIVMARTAEDPWEAEVISELDGMSEICTRVILGRLGIEQNKQTKADAMRVAGIIIRAGWRKDGKFTSGPNKGLSRYVRLDEGAL